jgi:TonB family protein
MGTVVRPPVPQDTDLHLLTEWGGAEDRSRLREARLVSVAVHIAAVVVLALMPKSMIREATTPLRQIMPLLAPPVEATQTAPNRGPISKEVTAEALTPRPRIQIPPSPPSTTRTRARQLGLPSPAPAAAIPEPPAIEAQARPAPRMPEAAHAHPPPAAPPAAPEIQPREQPKLAFENPGAPPPPTEALRRIARPNTSVSEAIRSAARGGGGGLTVGDAGAPGLGGIGEGINLPPSPGRAGSSLELLSDPMGVDFRPYLITILASVKRNWMAIMPESAKLGRRGRVQIQFSVSRMGSVPKLVIVSGSGTDALDRAAVAGISASNPFPPLPSEFKGDQIRLQFTFAYNMPSR